MPKVLDYVEFNTKKDHMSIPDDWQIVQIQQLSSTDHTAMCIRVWYLK